MADAMAPTRIVYLVFPTYDWSQLARTEDERNILQVIQRCNLLPSSLAKYDRESDAKIYRAVFEKRGFDVITDFHITRASFRERLSGLVSRCSDPDSVFVLVFGGHGENELGTRHASILFSDNKHITSMWLDEELSKVNGTTYVLFNCCTASGAPMVLPHNAHPYVSRNALTDGSTSNFSVAGTRRIDVFSTSHTESQKAKHGSRLAHAIQHFF